MLTQASSDVSTVLRDLAATERQACELVAGLSAAQANWRPHQGRSWSVVQCLSHLARINRLYAAAMYDAASHAHAARTASGEISPGWLGSWFLRVLEPPVRNKMKAPRKSVPAEQGDPHVALAEFAESHQPVQGVIEASSQLDLNRVRFKNPFVPLLRFTIGTGLLIITAHDRRHLWQAAQVRQAAGFPAK